MTLEIELQYPTPYFLELCAHSAFSPVCRSVDINNPSWPKSLEKAYICNGPFTIDAANNKEVTLKKNFLFWEKNHVKLEKVVISYMSEKESLSAFQDERLDALLYPFCKNQGLKLSNYLKIQKKKCVTEIRYLGFNCLKSPFTNAKLRQAFSLALQRKLLANSFSSESHPHYSAYSSEFSQLKLNKSEEENQDLAKRLFFEALKEEKLKPNIFNQEKIYATPYSQGIEKLIAKQLNNLFDLNLKPIVTDVSKLLSLIRKRKINICIYGWINRIQDPSYFLNTFSSPKNIINYSCWNSERIYKLIQLIQETDCLEVRRKLHYQAEIILQREKPVIPLISTSIYSQIQSNIHNIFIGDLQEFDIRYCYKK